MKREQPTFRAALAVVGALTAVNSEDILGRTRVACVARARQALMWLAVKRLGKSLTATGRLVGRDHTSTLHGVRSVDARLAAGDTECVNLIRRASERLSDPDAAAALIQAAAARKVVQPAPATPAEIQRLGDFSGRAALGGASPFYNCDECPVDARQRLIEMNKRFLRAIRAAHPEVSP